MGNGILVAMSMILLVAGLILVVSLPSYFTSTHKILFSLGIVSGSGLMLASSFKN